jgi:transcription elongation factor Elf1
MDIQNAFKTGGNEMKTCKHCGKEIVDRQRWNQKYEVFCWRCAKEFNAWMEELNRKVASYDSMDLSGGNRGVANGA